jgi:MFS family permease
MTAVSMADEASERGSASLRAWYALCVVLIASLFGFVDRQVLILVTAPMKAQMALSDTQIGVLLGAGPGLFGAAAAVGFGWLADRAPRQHILAACVLLWSVATAAFAFAHSFFELLLATVAVGLGEAALGPIFYSIVPDLFPGRTRTLANIIFFCAAAIGAGLGLSLSGALIDWIGSHRGVFPEVLSTLPAWRLAFLTVAIPGLPIAGAVAAIGRIERIEQSRKAGPMPGLTAYFRDNAGAVGGLCASMACYAAGSYATFTWIAPYISRDFRASPTQVGAGVGAALMLGSVAGFVLAGALAKPLSRRWLLMAPVRIYEASMLLAAIPLFLQFLARHSWEAYVLIGLQLMLTTVGTALIPTLWQDISPASLRGRVTAILTFAYTLVGAISPVLVGGLSDKLSSRPRGLLLAMLIVCVPSLLSSYAFLRMVHRPIQRTIEAYSPSAGAIA